MDLDILFNEIKENTKEDEIRDILNQINEVIKDNDYVFTSENGTNIYSYMLLCNKFEIKDVLDKLITKKDFIKLLDKTNIDGGVLPSLTSICTKPREVLLRNSKKLKNSIIKEQSILRVPDILSDLTKQEISILREDPEIDNYLILNGLSFNTLKDETIERLLNDESLFTIYDIYTISDFANSYKNKKGLINDDEFLSIYLDKLNDDYYYDNKIFKLLTIDKIKEILDTNPSLDIILHILKDTNETVQIYLLENKDLKERILNNLSEPILIKLPKRYILNYLSKQKNLFTPSIERIIQNLDKEEIKKLFNLNINFYKDFLENLKNLEEYNLKVLINALPDKYMQDFCENRLNLLDLDTLNKIAKSKNAILRAHLLKDKQAFTDLVKTTTDKTFNILDSILTNAEYTKEELSTLLNNITEAADKNVLSKLIHKIPMYLRKNIYENKIIRDVMYEDNENLDEYAISFLLHNLDELKKMDPVVIVEALSNSDINLAKDILEDDDVLKKIFASTEATKEIIDILHSNKYLLPILKSKKIITYATRDNIKMILDNMSIEEKQNIVTNDIILKLLNYNEDAFTLYKKLNNNNKYLLNTINLNVLLIPNIASIKLPNLELITKNAKLSEYIINMSKQISHSVELTDALITELLPLNNMEILEDCFKILSDSSLGLNRKLIGNIPKMIKTYKEKLNKSDIKALLNYLLYLRIHYGIDNQYVLPTPNSFKEIITYEKRYVNNIMILLRNNQENINEYLLKHYKMSLKEAIKFTEKYKIDKVDRKIYEEEYNFINTLNKLVKITTKLDDDNHIYTIYDKYHMIAKIKSMYAKIYNYEIKSRQYKCNQFIKELYGKQITIYKCPNEFLALKINCNLDEEANFTNDYFYKWHNMLETKKYIDTTLISGDKFKIDNDYTLCFDGLKEDGLVGIYEDNEEKYEIPTNVLNNSYANNVILDKYAIRANYNNGNIPNIEPDFILVDQAKLDDNNYLEKVSRISESFITKRNKNGLPIVAYDLEKIQNNEESKIKRLTTRYTQKYDMKLIPNILKKIGNNYIAFGKENFNFQEIINIVKERISKSNSVSELNFIKESFANELKRQKNNPYNLRELEITINKKIQDLEKESPNNQQK